MGYGTDLKDSQWALIEHIFKSNKGANHAKHDKRDLVNAVLYLVKTGCGIRQVGGGDGCPCRQNPHGCWAKTKSYLRDNRLAKCKNG